MKICNNCNFENDYLANYCSKCGKALIENNQDEKKETESNNYPYEKSNLKSFVIVMILVLVLIVVILTKSVTSISDPSLKVLIGLNNYTQKNVLSGEYSLQLDKIYDNEMEIFEEFSLDGAFVLDKSISTSTKLKFEKSTLGEISTMFDGEKFFIDTKGLYKNILYLEDDSLQDFLYLYNSFKKYYKGFGLDIDLEDYASEITETLGRNISIEKNIVSLEFGEKEIREVITSVLKMAKRDDELRQSIKNGLKNTLENMNVDNFKISNFDIEEWNEILKLSETKEVVELVDYDFYNMSPIHKLLLASYAEEKEFEQVYEMLIEEIISELDYYLDDYGYEYYSTAVEVELEFRGNDIKNIDITIEGDEMDILLNLSLVNTSIKVDTDSSSQEDLKEIIDDNDLEDIVEDITDAVNKNVLSNSKLIKVLEDSELFETYVEYEGKNADVEDMIEELFNSIFDELFYMTF